MPHFDLRNRDMSKKISFKYLWMKDMYSKLRLKFTQEELSNDELKNYLMQKYEERYKPIGRFLNNITYENKIMSLETFINTLINSTHILSGYCVLFKDHTNKNIAAEALKELLDRRAFYKNKMKKEEKGSLKYTYYKVLQLTYKVLANSYYGILGLKVSPFFNSFVQNSVTLSGQDIITTSITTMENFLGNNNKFEDLDDIIEFINNVKYDVYDKSILDYVDEAISNDKLLQYLTEHSKTEINVEYLSDIIKNLSDEERTRIYYKNRLIEFLKNKKMLEVCNDLLQNEYKENNEFRKLVCDFVFYDHILEDRFKRALTQTRNSVIACDTDSNFLYLYRLIEQLVDALGYERTEANELNAANMFIDLATEGLKRIFWELTTNVGIEDEYKPIINFKNEFIYLMILTTDAKKNYGGTLLAELGKKIECSEEEAMDKTLDIKGLAIRKSVVPKSIREKYTSILFHDILKADKIDLKEILDKFDDISAEVEISLRNGETKYATPGNIKVLESYKDPASLMSVRAIIAWNALEPEHQIVPPEKINMLKLVTTTKDHPLLLEIKETYPQKYKKIMKVIFNEGVERPKLDISDKGLAVIALPKDLEEIPDYIRPLIDYNAMVIANTSAGNILLKSLGIHCESFDQMNYKSNIFRG